MIALKLILKGTSILQLVDSERKMPSFSQRKEHVRMCFLSALLASIAQILLILPAHADALVDYTSESFAVLLESAGTESGTPSYTLSIKPGRNSATASAKISANAFTIESPTRLVIDIHGFASNATENLPIEADARLSRLRIGSHPDKTRIVLDLSGAPAVEYEVRANEADNTMAVRFSLNSALSRTPSPAPTSAQLQPRKKQMPAEMVAERTEKKQAAETLSSGAFGTQRSEEIEESRPEQAVSREVPSGAQQEVADAESGKPEQASAPALTISSEPIRNAEPKKRVVSGVSFRGRKGKLESSVMIEVDRLATYELKRKTSNLYELTLNDARLAGKHLLMAQFPPHSFSGLQVLVPREVGDKVKIKVYVSEGTVVEPYIADDKLWLRAREEK